ncbi:hypothetical protein D3C87_1494320 [compost metagenome]
MPILPPSCVSRPESLRIWAISAVVVDLPFVPVMAMKGQSGACARRSRMKSSISPIISTPAARARSTDQCGFGCVSGTPGASTKDEKECQSIVRRSAVVIPSASALATLSGLSSKATTSAPPATSARAVTRPEPPSPKSATFLPLNDETGIIAHLSFSVARPSSARPTEMIQKRMTTWLSVQPFFSK